MPIKIPLLFHFNQHLNQQGEFASQVCYTGLLNMLLDSPAKANIHISGTLIQALKWLDPRPLYLIKQGLDDGKFELLGSTHSQNVPFATDDRDNKEQIKLHREIIKNTFGVTPTTFWNPERCWRQSLLPVIAQADYKLITIEDHILNSADIHSYNVFSTSFNDYSINIIRDDEHLKQLINFAGWFGESQQLFDYLDQIISNDLDATHYLAYAEDAEAMGLWGYHKGVIPNQTWDRLANLLLEFNTHPDIEMVFFSDLPEPSMHIPELPDGSAAWMDASLGDSSLPYHEDGFENWLNYSANSEKVNFFRQYYDQIRNTLDSFHPKTKADDALLKIARHTYLTNQYEFGCIGIGGEKSRTWRGAAGVIPILQLGNTPKHPGFTTFEIENKAFQLLSNSSSSAILTHIGGRVLFWADSQNGQLIIGNPSSIVPGEYNGIEIAPDVLAFQPRWIPDGQPFDRYMIEEAPPSRMRRFLAPWVWNKHPENVSLAVRDMKLEGDYLNSLPAQQGAFFDEIFVDSNIVFDKSSPMKWTGTGYRSIENEDLVVEKSCSFLSDRLRMTYHLTAEKASRVKLNTYAELTGDYESVLREGRSAIQFIDGAAIRINETGETIRLNASVPVKDTIQRNGLLSLIVGIGIDLEIRKKEKTEIVVEIIRS